MSMTRLATIDPSSAFDTSLPGINVVGFGQTENGTTKNMILLAGEIADSLEKEPFDQAEFENLLNAFDDWKQYTVLEQVTTLGNKIPIPYRNKRPVGDR